MEDLVEVLEEIRDLLISIDDRLQNVAISSSKTEEHLSDIKDNVNNIYSSM